MHHPAGPGQTVGPHANPYIGHYQMANIVPHFSTAAHAMAMKAAPPTFAPLAQPSSTASTIPYPHPILCAYSTEEPATYIFQCCNPTCGGITFGRWPDFTRHYNGIHATSPKVYWCAVEGCPRSEIVGDDPFTRKDKLKDHVKSMHRGRSSG